MPLFVLMTRLTPEASHDARGRRALGKEWLSRVKTSCPDVKWVAHYAILGPYDFMDIYEAPDDETAHKVSLISRSFPITTVATRSRINAYSTNPCPSSFDWNNICIASLL